LFCGLGGVSAASLEAFFAICSRLLSCDVFGVKVLAMSLASGKKNLRFLDLSASSKARFEQNDLDTRETKDYEARVLANLLSGF
jgi:hypothetical protein